MKKVIAPIADSCEHDAPWVSGFQTLASIIKMKKEIAPNADSCEYDAPLVSGVPNETTIVVIFLSIVIFMSVLVVLKRKKNRSPPISSKTKNTKDLSEAVSEAVSEDFPELSELNSSIDESIDSSASEFLTESDSASNESNDAEVFLKDDKETKNWVPVDTDSASPPEEIPVLNEVTLPTGEISLLEDPISKEGPTGEISLLEDPISKEGPTGEISVLEDPMSKKGKGPKRNRRRSNLKKVVLKKMALGKMEDNIKRLLGPGRSKSKFNLIKNN